MKVEIMLAMPIYQLASLCLTVGFKPNYDNENSDMFTEVDSVCIPNFDIDAFLQEAKENHIFGLEVNDVFGTYSEFMEECPTIATFLKSWSVDTCPQIINAIYIDEMGNAKLVASGLEMSDTQWSISNGLFGRK